MAFFFLLITDTAHNRHVRKYTLSISNSFFWNVYHFICHMLVLMCMKYQVTDAISYNIALFHLAAVSCWIHENKLQRVSISKNVYKQGTNYIFFQWSQRPTNDDYITANANQYTCAYSIACIVCFNMNNNEPQIKQSADVLPMPNNITANKLRSISSHNRPSTSLVMMI